MPNPGDWTANPGARGQFLRLAQDTGIFLENRLAELASAFAGEFTQGRGARINAESIAYGSDTEESPLRQIDQRVQFYKEFVLDERTGIQLIMCVPIEAKYRRDVEACAVAYPAGSYRPELPLISDLHGSRLGASLRAREPFTDYKLSQPVFIEVEKGITPKRVFGENVVYNAASALYDFIQFDCDRHREEPRGKTFIEKMKLIDRFEKYLAEKHYAWWSVIHEWMSQSLTSALVSEFNRQCMPNRCFFGVRVFGPVLFVSGPLHELADASDPNDPLFRPCDAMITRVRVPGWPGKIRRNLLGYTAEAPLLITNDRGLRQLLISCMEGFFALESTLKRSQSALGEWWPIEAAFYQTALLHFLHDDDSEVRSDLDIFDWFHPHR